MSCSGSSCEPRRTNAYSEDLRWRMVWQREGLGKKCSDVAVNLGVDPATVSRTVARFRQTGDVQKKSYPSDRAFRKLTLCLEFMIIHLVLMRPGVLLREIQAELLDLTGADISLSTICRFLHKSGFTRQKLRLVALQRDNLLRSQFASDVSIFNQEMLIFLDETGSDKRNCMKQHGYSLRGKPLVSHKLLVRGERVSAIAIMSVNGILDCKTVKQTVNGDVFYNFVQANLLPHLMPFDGRNPHSVVILDNCAIHHVEGIVDMIQEVGALVIFLPPYSPDYNPIEEAFSDVKQRLRGMDAEADLLDTETLLLAAFSSITANDCQGWIDHVGIY